MKDVDRLASGDVSRSASRQFRVFFVLCLLLLAACAPSPAPAAVVTLTPTVTPERMPCSILPYASGVTEAMTAFADEYAHVSGPADAPVLLLVFTDFQCPGCAALAESIRQVQAAHPQEVQVILRYLPDARFDKSGLAILAAEAAAQQGKFWEMHDLLFSRQAEWSALPPEDFPTWAQEQAAALGLDAGQFAADFAGEAAAARLRQAQEAAADLAYTPPLLYLNSVTPYTGLADPASLEAMVQLALLEGRKFHTCPPWRLNPARQYIVTLHTARGDVVLQLFPEKAPLAVNNFVFLARADWYDGVPFHRVDPGFVVQTGDPSGTGYGNPGYYFATEPSALTFDRPGLVAMSNTGPDTSGSQFFITYAALPELNGQFTIFGEVLSGMDVLAGLSAGDLLLDVSVEER